jgi:hypothetical protein
VIDDSILPRDEQDSDAIERYALDFDKLPPIVVQKDTFKLIGGKSRLLAAPKATRDHVRIAELDVPDEELWELAYQDNREHGVPYKLSERTNAGRRYLKAHPNLSDGVIADWAGVGRDTVQRWRQQNNAHQQAAAERASGLVPAQPAGFRQVATRVGRDGRERRVPAPSHANGFTPAPKPQSPSRDQDHHRPVPVVIEGLGQVWASPPDVNDIPDEEIDDAIRFGEHMVEEWARWVRALRPRLAKSTTPGARQ